MSASVHPAERLERNRPSPLEVQPPITIAGLSASVEELPNIEELPAIPELDTEHHDEQQELSEQDMANMHCMTAVRFLVMIQPVVAGMGVSVVFLRFYITRSSSNICYDCMIVVSILFLLSLIEIYLISRYLKYGRLIALGYNLLNKAFYCGELLILATCTNNFNSIYFCICTVACHLMFLALTFMYKKKKSIYHYMQSVVNPLVILQLLICQIRLQGILTSHLLFFLIPSMMFCAVYLGMCVYFSVLLCKEIGKLDSEDYSNEENSVQIGGFASVLLIVILTNIFYLALLAVCGIYLELILTNEIADTLKDHSFTVFIGILMACLLILMFIWVRRNVLRKYFCYQFLKTIKLSEKEPATPSRSKIRSKFLLRMSGTYFNRDDVKIKSHIKINNMVKKFAKDIKREVEIQGSRFRTNNFGKEASGNGTTTPSKFKRTDSMQDIYSTPVKIFGRKESTKNTQKLLKTPLKTPIKTPKIRTKTSINTPSNTPRKQMRQNSVNISSFNMIKYASPDLSSPKRLRMNRQLMQKEISKKVELTLLKIKFEPDSLQCMICHEQVADCIVEPCLHGGCCTGCTLLAFTKGDQRCVLCRQPIAKIYKSENHEGNIVKIVEDITPQIQKYDIERQ